MFFLVFLFGLCGPQARRRFRRRLERERAEAARVARLNVLRGRVVANAPQAESDDEEVEIEVDVGEVPWVEHPATSNSEGEQIIVQQEINIEEQEENGGAVNIGGEGDDARCVIDSEDSSSEHERSGNDSDQDNPQVFRNEEERELYVVETVRDWARTSSVKSMNALDKLLKGLHVAHPTLPLSYKTLLETPTDLNLRELADGSLIWYKGLKASLDAMELEEYLLQYRSITVDINIDELPLSKSSKLKFWHILGHLVGSENEPFVISIYFSEWDPLDVHSFLHDYINDVEDLHQNGYMRGENMYGFRIRNYILDAPARSLIKCCVGHGGYGACEKCTVPGENVNDRIVYLDLDAPLRSDLSFSQQEDRLHHISRPPLERLGTGMVSQFRLDGFHLVWHGVFKRFVEALITWVGPWKLSLNAVNAISEVLIFLAEFCPSDFCRPPRNLNDWKLYKATEERRMCLYDGLLVLRDQVDENVYKLYLLLEAAMYILCSPVFVVTHWEFAEQCLRTFIQHAAVVFGQKFVVYNVHCLSHMAKECRDHGCLDSFSAFKFENELKTIKSSLKSCFKPLQQAALRNLERNRRVPVKLRTAENIVTLSREHAVVNEVVHGTHYQMLSIGSLIKLRADNSKDSCFRTVAGDVFILKDIVKTRDSVYLIGYKFMEKGDFYNYPLPSSQLGILQLSNLNNNVDVVSLQDVEAKCYLMPDGNNFLCVPLLHSTPLF